MEDRDDVRGSASVDAVPWVSVERDVVAKADEAEADTAAPVDVSGAVDDAVVLNGAVLYVVGTLDGPKSMTVCNQPPRR